MKLPLTAIALLISLNGFGQKDTTTTTWGKIHITDSGSNVVSTSSESAVWNGKPPMIDTSYGIVEYYRNGKRVSSPATRVIILKYSVWMRGYNVDSESITLPSGKLLNPDKYFLFISKDMEQ